VCSLSIGGGSGAASFAAAGDSAVDAKYRYRMDHRRRGQFIIINNRTFHPDTHMNERKGTDVDASNLYADFKQLGFNVKQTHNQTASQMLQLMAKGNYCVCTSCTGIHSLLR